MLDIVKPKSNSKSQIQVPNPNHKFKSSIKGQNGVEFYQELAMSDFY